MSTLADAAVGASPQQMQAAQQMENSPEPSDSNNNEVLNQVAGGALINLFEDDESFNNTLNVLDSNPDDPPQAIGTVVGNNMAAMYTEAMGQGKLIPSKVMSQVAQILSNTVTDIAVSRGIVQQGQENDIAEDAISDAFLVFSNGVNMQQMPPEERQAYSAMMDELGQINQIRTESNQPSGDQNV